MSKDQNDELSKLSAYEIYAFASFLPTRGAYTGRYKRHKTLHHAKSAITSAAHQLHFDKSGLPAKVFQWDDEEDSWLPVLEWNSQTYTWTDIK